MPHYRCDAGGVFIKLSAAWKQVLLSTQLGRTRVGREVDTRNFLKTRASVYLIKTKTTTLVNLT
jgi:hypothetical protein